jgi:hypothetical protein
MSQTCKFCSEQELLDIFLEEKTEYNIGYTDGGIKYYYIEHGFCTQIYYFHYEINTVYAVLTKSENYAKVAVSKLNDSYTRLTTTTWKSEDSNIEFQYEDGIYAIVFTYK